MFYVKAISHLRCDFDTEKTDLIQVLNLFINPIETDFWANSKSEVNLRQNLSNFAIRHELADITKGAEYLADVYDGGRKFIYKFALYYFVSCFFNCSPYRFSTNSDPFATEIFRCSDDLGVVEENIARTPKRMSQNIEKQRHSVGFAVKIKANV